MKKSHFLWIVGGVLLLSICLLVWIIAGPTGPIIVSKQTTYLTEPVGPNGLIDYERAILDLQAANVSPEKNAAIPFLQATWPADIEPADQPRVCDALQMPMPNGPAMQSFEDNAVKSKIADWVSQQHQAKVGDQKLEPMGPAETIDIIYETLSVPWSREQLPPLAEWVDAQTPHFAKLHEMNDRPDFFLPSVTFLDDQHQTLFAALLPTVQHQRQVARALSIRAMLAIGENRPADAWGDIKTIFTISRCHAKPGFLVELLVANAIRGVALGELTTLLDSGQCDAALLTEIEAFLAQTKPFDDMAPSINVMERLGGLDAAIGLTTHPELNLDATIGSGDGRLSSLAYAPFDRNAMLAKLNEWYDRIAASAAIDNLDDRQAAMEQLELDLQAETQDSFKTSNVTGAIFNQRTRGELVAKGLVGMLMPSVTQAVLAEERSNTQLQLVRVAVALEKYKIETGDYPDTLTPLATRTERAIFNDPYAAGLLRYQKRPPGYLLYSVFQDRLDDGGTSAYGDIIQGEWITTEPTSTYPNGDQVIRFPQPKKSISDVMPWNLPQAAEEEDWPAEIEPEETAPEATDAPIIEAPATEPAAVKPEPLAE